jgi:hypothetical protein
MMDLATLTAQDFAARTGEVFVLHTTEESSFETRLIEVSEGQGGYSRQQFSLVFRGGPEHHASQGTYRLDNDAMGSLAIFLVPIGPDAHGQRYQAVFG